VSQNNDIFDDFLKSAMADLEGDVSSQAWDQIASKLDAPKRRRVIGWWLLAGMLAIGLGIGILSTLDQNQEIDGTTLDVDVIDQNSSETTSPIDQNASKDIQVVEEATEIEESRSVDQIPTIKLQDVVPTTPAFEIVNDGVNDGLNQSFTDWTFENLRIEGKQVPQLTDIMSAPINKAIFYASEKDAHEFNRIPTSNKGSRKAPGTPSNKGSWELGLSASPAFAAKLIKPNGDFSGLLNQNYKGITEKDEKTGFSYQLALNANLHINKWLYISSGLQYNQLGEAIDYDFVIDSAPVLNATKTRIDSMIPIDPRVREHVQYNGHNTYHYAEIPVKLGIVVPILRDRVELRTEVGIQFSYLFATSGKKIDLTFLSLNNLDLREGYNRVNMGGVVTSGLYFITNERMEWGVTPYYQMSLTSIRSATSAIQERPYNYGLNVRFNYRLNTGKQ